MFNSIGSIINYSDLCKINSGNYKATIIDLKINKYKKIGRYLTVVFEFIDKEKIHHFIEKYVSYQNQDFKISEYFKKFVNIFSNEKDLDTFLIKELVGKKCFVSISTLGFPRITNIDSA